MMFSPYIRLARIDNWSKNLLVLLGVAVSVVMTGLVPSALDVFLTLVAACFSSSANYILNESIDSSTDAYHPLKKKRSSVVHNLHRGVVCTEYALFAICSIAVALAVGNLVTVVILTHIVCAWIYNIPPVRFKDLAYLDVILESINYPLRFLMGWLCAIELFPPSSLLIVSWAIGAFAMGSKRLAELQMFSSREAAALYRRSYALYTKDGLVVSGFVYAMLTILGSVVLILKYKIELILIMPLFIIMLTWYQYMGLRSSLFVVYPERLVANKVFLLLIVTIILFSIILLQVEIPVLKTLIEPVQFS